jgi:SLT domain-containing protein
LLKLGKDKIVDPFFKLITRSAFNLLLKVAEPAKKLLQPLANAKIPPGLFRAAAGKLGLKAFDGLLKFIESKVAPDMVEAGIGVAAMAAEVMKRFKGLVITSALRPGDPGYHGRGWARDLGGPVPLMNRAGAWMQTAMVSGLLEGIHNPTLSVKNYKRVPSGFWGGEWPAHADHIHMAAPPAGSAGPSVGPDSIRRIVANIAAKFGLTHLINVAMARIKQESGFNPRAINNWDINARAGTPSVGLAQIIGPTFAAYAAPAFRNKPPMWHGVSLDPWAQIDTMFRYSIARYGKAGLFRAWSGTQGYAEGGILAEPVFGIGLRTGTAYALGERGPELVTPLDGQQPRRSIVVNVYPARGMDETELAASVARRLAWAQATGRA